MLFYYHYGSTILCWAFTAFSASWSYTQSVGLLGRGISPSQGLYLYTEQHKHRINSHNTDIHALSGIRTHDPRIRASEDSSCLRPSGDCDRQCCFIVYRIDCSRVRAIMSCGRNTVFQWIICVLKERGVNRNIQSYGKQSKGTAPKCAALIGVWESIYHVTYCSNRRHWRAFILK
jgi:hypothetical protein